MATDIHISNLASSKFYITQSQTISVSGSANLAIEINSLKNKIIAADIFIDYAGTSGSLTGSDAVEDLFILPGYGLYIRGANARSLDGLPFNLRFNPTKNYTNAGTGAFSTISEAGSVITVTRATTNPDFIDYGNGDTIRTVADGGASGNYTISSTSTNTITLTASSPALGEIESAFAIEPSDKLTNVAIGKNTGDIHFQNLTISQTTFGIDSLENRDVTGRIFFKNCLFTSSNIIYIGMATYEACSFIGGMIIRNSLSSVYLYNSGFLGVSDAIGNGTGGKLDLYRVIITDANVGIYCGSLTDNNILDCEIIMPATYGIYTGTDGSNTGGVARVYVSGSRIGRKSGSVSGTGIYHRFGARVMSYSTTIEYFSTGSLGDARSEAIFNSCTFTGNTTDLSPADGVQGTANNAENIIA